MVTRNDLLERRATSRKLSCGRNWSAPMPGTTNPNHIIHLCRSHIVQTGECVCPCGARDFDDARTT